MNNLWYSFREFKNSIIFKIIIIIQITIAITLLYRVNEIKDYENNKLKEIEQITEDKKNYQFVSKYDSIDDFLSDQQIPNKFSDFARDAEKKFTLVTTVFGEVELKKFKGIESFIDEDFKKIEIQNNYALVNSIACSSNFFDIFDIKLSQGSFDGFDKFTELNSLDWEGKEIPIILGDAYKSTFRLNEVIDSQDNAYKVVGFMERDQFFLDKGIYHLTRVKNLNTFAIVPVSKNIMDANINNAFLVLKDKPFEDFKYVKGYVDDLAEKHNVKLSILDPDTNIEGFLENLNYSANIKLLIIYLIIFFVIIGLVVIFTNRVESSRKEFSIHILYGATIKDISIRIILEHLFLVFIATIASFCYLIQNNAFVINDILQFMPIQFLKSALMIIMIIFLVSLIPVYYMRKYKLNYLIKGD